jgi:hypothetical protein
MIRFLVSGLWFLVVDSLFSLCNLRHLWMNQAVTLEPEKTDRQIMQMITKDQN